VAGERCQRCGTTRTGWFRYCRACGLDLDTDLPDQKAARRTSSRLGTDARVASVAAFSWFVCALLLVADLIANGLGAPRPSSLVAWSGIPAAAAIYIGLTLMDAPGRASLVASAVGGVAFLAIVMLRIAMVSDAVLLASIWAIAATMLSLLGLAAPAQGPRRM
jgi:hypothetical protein